MGGLKFPIASLKSNKYANHGIKNNSLIFIYFFKYSEKGLIKGVNYFPLL